MTKADIDAITITINLLLDELWARGDDVLIETALSALGDLLAGAGGLPLMATVFEGVLDQRPDVKGWREGVLDARWSGFGGWSA